MAGGMGKRMGGDLPKVLVELAGRPLLEYVIDTAKALNPKKIIVVTGYKRELVIERFAGSGLVFAVQDPQLGTGHAVMQAGPALEGFDGNVVVLSGDVPLLRPETLQKMLKEHTDKNSAITCLSAVMENPGAYGRIVRDGDRVIANVEAKDADEATLLIKEINAGVYVFDAEFLLESLSKLSCENAQNEYYLTDLISMATTENLHVGAVVSEDISEISGVNSRDDLADLERMMKK
jgi:UDP-N-acetylglucosamine diphosphorylase/glucosamine-1-phosphate N-acetyltransferase